MSILLLCGGVGGAKLALGFMRVLPPQELTILVNTGDDFEHCGLTICPDLDTVTYTLADVVNPGQGWGRQDESLGVFEELRRLGGETWFLLGDRDIALHLLRLSALQSGQRLTEVTAMLCSRLGVLPRVLPMSDQRVRTMVGTAEGWLPFQEYFVGQRCAPVVTGFRFDGVESASLTPEVEQALADPALTGIVIAPSNPYVSIGPILAVPGMRQKLLAVGVPILAVAPIIGDRAVKGPAAKMLAELGEPVSALSVARYYGDFIDHMLVDETDAHLAAMPRPGLPPISAVPTLMHTLQDREMLARACLEVLATL